MMKRQTEHQLPTAGETYSRVGLSLFVVGLVSVGLQLLASVVLGFLSDNGHDYTGSTWMTWLATFLPIYAVAIPAGLLMMRRLPVESSGQSGLGGKNFCFLLLMCFPMMYGGNIVGTLLSMLLSGGAADNALVNYIFDDSPLKIAVIVVLAPLLEEFVFRKQIIDRCGKYGEKPAILFSALTFALFHMNLFQLFYAFGLGLVLAYVYTRTRRLRYPVIMHMVVNFMGSVLAPWILTQVDLEALTQVESGVLDETVMMAMLPGLMLYGGYVILLLGLSITGLVLLIVKARKLVFLPASEELPTGQRFKTVYCNVGVILFVILCLGMCVVSLAFS